MSWRMPSTAQSHWPTTASAVAGNTPFITYEIGASRPWPDCTSTSFWPSVPRALRSMPRTVRVAAMPVTS
jgi:hypothetical protein